MTSGRTLVIAWLYGTKMNIYGDRGNVLALAQRACWRGIAPEVVGIGLGEPIPDEVDIFFFGGGQDQAADLRFEGPGGRQGRGDQGCGRKGRRPSLRLWRLSVARP